MVNNSSIRELLDLRGEYEQAKIILANNKENLTQKKREIYGQVIESIKGKIDYSPNNDRLQKYLESTSITNFVFLFRSLNYMAGNNQLGSLSLHQLLLLDEEVKNIALKYNVTSENIFWKIFYNNRNHPFLENAKVKEAMTKVTRLAFLDEIFKNIDNILNYQGAYTVYQYVKRYLKESLKEGIPQSDQELVYKDYNEKLEIILANLSNVASYFLDIRNQIPNSRLALCNHSLFKMSRKLAGTNITFEQNVFASGIAFGTTLEKLKDGNYEDAEKLIFIPHQKVLKKY